MTQQDVNFFDLVKTASGDRYTVIGGPKDGLALLTKNTWPFEFAELEGHKPPSPLALGVEKLEVVCGGRHRLTVLADLMREHADKADAAGALDWNDVDAALVEAAKIVPTHHLEVDENGGWKLHEVIPAELAEFAKPAAIILATHVHGRGEADAGAISEAYEAARAVPASFTQSAGPSPRT